MCNVFILDLVIKGSPHTCAREFIALDWLELSAGAGGWKLGFNSVLLLEARALDKDVEQWGHLNRWAYNMNCFLGGKKVLPLSRELPSQ